MPLAFITAQTGRNVKALLNLSQSMFKQASQRVGTGTLNRVVREAVEAHPPAGRDSRNPRIYYATQVGTAPPTIVLFVNYPVAVRRRPISATCSTSSARSSRSRTSRSSSTSGPGSQTDPNAPATRDDDLTADAGSRVEGGRRRSGHAAVGRTRARPRGQRPPRRAGELIAGRDPARAVDPSLDPDL